MATLLIACFGTSVSAELDTDVEFAFKDQQGEPLANVVVYALPDDKMEQGALEIVDQISHQFVPHVLPVQQGTLVNFPNNDDVRHHVYSFSEAKTFELPLYSGVPAEPVHFDQVGEVVLGCNIHDRMLGYIYVVETSAFAVTDANGYARLTRLPSDAKAVHFWHPRAEAPMEPISMSSLADHQKDSVITLKIGVTSPPEMQHDDPEPGDLQQRFRRFRSQ